MKIVGVGAGPGLLTEEAISVIENAQVIFGSKRALELAKEHIKCEASILTDYTLKMLPGNAVVLSTGDPMLSGLGKYAKNGDEIIPGISSLQLACARLRLDIDDISVITAHSRDIDAIRKRLLSELNRGKNVFLLPDSSFGALEVAKFLSDHGLLREIAVCQQLGYPDEKIVLGNTDKSPSIENDMYCLVITSNELVTKIPIMIAQSVGFASHKINDLKLIETEFNNVYKLSGASPEQLITKNLVPGINVNNEKPLAISNEEFRIWDPFHSKLAAMIVKGFSLKVKKESTFLYLGAANGTTVSHVSDMVENGMVYAVEISPRAMKDLIKVSIPRKNIVPILADAMNPGSYKNMVPEVDFLYQDISQRGQARIAIKNAELFLKNEGILVLIIKAKSIDSIKKTKDVFETEIKKLEGIFNLKQLFDLGPCHKDHMAVVAQKLGR
jgi:precorrin-6y C5,15-methyltransferase (decarboxylating) CbiE subunit